MEKDNLNGAETKQLLIQYLFSILELSKFRYKLVENKSDLRSLETNNFYVSANFSGISSLLIFIKLKGKSYAFTIDRRTLSYSINNINFNTVKLYPVRIRLEENIYNGTIFDGIFVNNGNKREFIIYDVFYFRGKDMTNDNIYYKMMNLMSYFTSYYKNDLMLNNLEIIVNKLYPLNELKHLMEDIIPDINNIKGISFQPEISCKTQKLIYLFTDKESMSYPKQMKKQIENQPYQTEKRTEKQIEKQIDYSSNENIQINKNKLEDDCILTFKMKSTKIEDVYKLYLIYKSKKDHKTIIKNIKIDIAYIPDIATSKLCKNSIKNKDDVLMNCKYSKDKEKWIPIELNDKKDFPTLINEYL